MLKISVQVTSDVTTDYFRELRIKYTKAGKLSHILVYLKNNNQIYLEMDTY